MSELTSTDTAIVKGQKVGFAIGLPIAILLGIAKCSGVDFRSDYQKFCESNGGIYQAPRGAVAVCLKKTDIIELPPR